MGIIKKISKKIVDIAEETSKYLSGDSKTEFEAQEAEVVEVKKEKVVEGYTFKKDQAKDLDKLLGQANFVDGRHLWIAGFDNFKANQNAAAANLFSGKKNLKFLSFKDGDLYLIKFDKDVLLPYRVFSLNDVLLVDTVTKMAKSSIKIKFKDDTQFSIDITENKGSIKDIKDLFK